jgi:drug/metabolite transporter (DMT)-like permease
VGRESIFGGLKLQSSTSRLHFKQVTTDDNGSDKTPKAVLQNDDTRSTFDKSNDVFKVMEDRMDEFPVAFWRGLALLVCIIWSTNFAVVKGLQEQDVPGLDPSLYTAIRFSIASIVMLPQTFGKWTEPNIKNGLIVSCFKMLGYVGQTIGMLTSTADKSAFICSMNVVWVALVTGMMTKRIKLNTWVSVILAVIGVGIFELEGASGPVIGDAWLALQPIGFGSSYIVLEKLLSMENQKDDMVVKADPGALSAFTLLGVAAMCTTWAAMNGHTLNDVGPVLQNDIVRGSLLYTGLVTTAGGFLLQSLAFKRVPATDVSIILTSEPIFASALAAVLLGETVHSSDIMGGFLIISACLNNELKITENAVNAFGKEETSGPGKV